MNYLLEPAIRWMNRLKYGYKFTLIGFLIFLQAAVLIYLLVAELNRNIDLAEKERMGIQYEVSLTDLLETAQDYRTLHYDYLQNPAGKKQELLDQQTKVDQALDAWEALERQTGDQLDTGWKTQWVRQEWLKRKDGALETPAGQEQAAFDLDSRWLDEIVDLMQHVGYSSNLAMDSDFDTSYLVDSVLRKMPELADHLNKAVALASELQNPNLSAERKSRLLQYVGLERSVLEQIGHNSQLVFRHNEQVRNKLNKIHGTLADSVPIFAWNMEQKVVGQQGLPIPQELLASTGKQAIQNTMAAQRGDLQVIDELLLARIGQYGQHRNGVLFFSGAILLLLCYLFIGLDLSVRRAVYQLVGVMHRVRKGDWAVRGKVLSQDEMGSLTTSINTTLDSLQKMYEEVQRSHACIEAWNQELEQKIAERTASLRSLLDHAGQGFLSFGADLTVSNEYSAECRTIFERPIGGESVAKLLYPDNEAERDFLAELFAKLFTEQKRMMRETYLSLLPEEIQIGDRSIGISYKLLNSKPPLIEEKIMMVLTDLTLQKSMENQMQEERDVLSMVVHVVTHSDDFFTTVNQYIDFCQGGMEKRLQETRPAAEILAVLFRTVHTFKGSFGQLRMNHLMEKLHGLEEKLGKVRSEQGSSLTIGILREALEAFKPAVLLKWLEEDREILKETLGDGFFEQENRIVIDSERLLELEAKVQEVLPPDECRILLPELRKLRYKSLKELLESYPEYTVALAERNEKAVALFDIDGGETMVDPLAYQDFVKSLGHVFRNAVVHGLESMEERLKAGKSETGRIRCRIEDEAAGMRIRISDDGRGMEPEKIGRLALHKGICTEEELAAMNEQQRLQLVFADGFSGAKQVNELAGRGVGLSAVLAEIKKLGGSVQIQSTPGTGTEFIFFLPFTAADHCAA